MKYENLKRKIRCLLSNDNSITMNNHSNMKGTNVPFKTSNTNNKPKEPLKFKKPLKVIESNKGIENIKELEVKRNREVDIIIPVKGNWNYVQLCINSIRENCKNIDYRIMLSITAEYESQTFRDIRIDKDYPDIIDKDESIYKLFHPHITSFAKSVNEIIAYGKNEYILILNDDVLITENAIENMIEHMEKNEKIGAVGTFSNCFTGDTKIKLLNGKNVSFKWLCKNYGKEKFYTYSYNRKRNKIVVGEIKNPRITGKNVQLVKVILDDNEEIKCTPGHRFLMRDGSYREAQELCNGDSLMPLKTRISTEENTNIKLAGYRQFYDVIRKKWIFVHHMVRNWLYGNIVKSGYLTHHKDFNKLNNDPPNLRYMTFKKHGELHEKCSNILKKLWDDPIFRKRNKKRLQSYWRNPDFINMQSMKAKKLWKNKEYRNMMIKVIKKTLKKCWKNKNYRKEKCKTLGGNGRKALNRLWKESKYRKMMGELSSKRNVERWRRDGGYRKIMCNVISESNKNRFKNLEYKNKILRCLKIANKKMWRDPLYKEWQKKYRCLGSSHPDFISFKDYKKQLQLQLNNHKVKKVIWLKKKEDVYDIEIPKYHNFALKAGIFVHNCDKGWRHNLTPVVEQLQLVPAMTIEQVTEGRIPGIYKFGSNNNTEKKGQKQWVDWIAFYCTLIKRDVWNEVGPMDENLTMVYNDRDWCFTGDTKIKLLNGKNVSLKWLCRNYGKEKYYTYSYDKEKNKVVVGKIKNPRIIRRNAKLVKVILDNNEEIKCTPDHRFLMRDGSYRKAQELCCGDSLMPLRTRITNENIEKLIGYRQFYDVVRKKWMFVHCMVHDYMYDNLRKRGYLTHHKDFNKKNNNPDNLRYMTFIKHSKLHKKGFKEFRKKLWADPIFYKKMCKTLGGNGRKALNRLWKDPKYIKKMKKITSEWSKKLWRDIKHKEKMSDVISRSNKNRWKDPIYKQKTIRRLSKLWKDPIYVKWVRKGHQRLGKNHSDFISFKDYKKQLQLNNHKVKKVIWLKKKEDVYDIEIPRYHNFALKAGIFVHNCDRAAEKGYKFIYAWDAFVFHFGAITRKEDEKKDHKAYHEEDKRNEEYYKKSKKTRKVLNAMEKDYSNSSKEFTVEIGDTPPILPTRSEGDKSKNNIRDSVPQKELVVFYSGGSWEAWSPDNIKNGGIGGSETCQIHVMKELVKLGYKVISYSDCREKAGVYDGVEYRQHVEFLEWCKNNKMDYFVSVRQPNAGTFPVQARKKYLWNHDTWYGGKVSVYPQNTDKFIVLSPWHKKFWMEKYGHGIKEEQLHILPNGIDLSRFENDDGKYVPNSLIYSSSYDRGLDILVNIFPRIKEEIKDLTLNVYYGSHNLDEWVKKSNNEQLRLFKINMLNQIENVNHTAGEECIKLHGRIDQFELARRYMASEMWLYPTYFYETFCCSGDSLVDCPRDYRKYPNGIPIKKLVRKKNFPVYSFNRKKEKFELQNVKWVKKTRKNARVLKITLDNNDCIKITPDHLVLLKKGVYRKAKNLKVGDSLMALYKDIGVSVNTLKGGKNEAILTALWKYKKEKTNKVTHHKSGCSWDNNPENLELITRSEHAVKTFTGREYKYRKKSLEMKKKNYQNTISGRTKKEKKKLSKIYSKNGHSFWDNLSKNEKEKFVNKRKIKMMKTKKDRMKDELYRKYIKGIASINALIQHGTIYDSECNKKELKIFKKKLRERVEYLKNKKLSKNHKIIRIEHGGHEDVYNMEVEKNHNFVINGIVIHNCITALEAMAAGCLVLTRPLAALETTVGDCKFNGEGCYMIDGNVYDRDVQDKYVRKAIEVLNHHSDIKIKSIWRQTAYVKEFSWDKVVNDYWLPLLEG